MTPAILNMFVPKQPAKADSGTGTATSDPSLGTDSFAALLTGKLGALVAAAKPAPSAAAGESTELQALQAKIAKLLKAGASQNEIISTLAAQLAASTAQGLGAGTADARSQLQAVFAGALAPPGETTGEPGSTADPTHALAQRFLKIQKLANEIVNGGKSGQQNRIAGNFLDAVTAKETPARTAGSKNIVATAEASSRTDVVSATAEGTVVPAGAVSAVASDAAVRAADVDVPVKSSAGATAIATQPALFAQAEDVLPALVGPVSPTEVGDGRSVKLGAKPATAGNGDTMLGRVLTRASLAADARETAVAAQSPEGQKAAPDSALAAFIKTFQAAVQSSAGTADTVLKDQDTSPAPALTAPGQDQAATPQPFVPAVAPFSIERTAPTPPAAAVPTPTVDQSAIIDQVLRGIQMRTTGASSEMRLSLVPESLGDVNIKLIVTGGNVTAQVVADTPDVRDALVAAQPQLTKSLAEAGLKLQSFTVDLSGNGLGGFSQGQSDHANTGDRSRGTPLFSHDDADDTALDAVPSFGPSIASSLDVGDYNYLV